MDATLEAFLAEYARRTNTHQFAAVAPLIAADAVYWFSDGSHRGLDSIRLAFERETFSPLAMECIYANYCGGGLRSGMA
jgi:hypothetical protein